MNKRFTLCLLAFVAVMLLGCAFQQMVDTPEERALAIMKTWDNQYDDTMAIAEMCQAGECSDGQKALVVKKKKYLKILKPLVDLYVNKIQTDGTVPDTIEAAIRKLINQLVAGIDPTKNTEEQVQDLINKLVAGG